MIPGECADTPNPPGPLGQTITATLDESNDVFAVSVEPGDDPVLDLQLAPEAQVYEAGGELRPVRVIDTRTSRPGWSVSGQAAPFTGEDGSELAGAGLGWEPTVLAQAPDQVVMAGPAVAPDPEDGVTAGALLASAGPDGGRGTARVTAAITLQAPTSTPPGSYRSTLTLTAI